VYSHIDGHPRLKLPYVVFSLQGRPGLSVPVGNWLLADQRPGSTNYRKELPRRARAALASGASGIEIADRGAFFVGGGAEHAVKRGNADAKLVFLADEMMAQAVLLDPAAQPRSRLVGNMRDVMHHS
jgi:hypothetical protein